MSEALEVPFYFCRGILRSDTITFFKYFLSFGETTLKEAWFWGCLFLHISFLFALISSVWKQFRGPAQWMMLIGLHGVTKARKSYTIMTLCKLRLGWPGSSTESRDLILVFFFLSKSVPNNDYLRSWRMRSGKSGRPGSSTDSHLPLQHRHALLSSTPAGWWQWWWWWRLWSWSQWWWWWLVSRFIYRFDCLVHFLLYILNKQHAQGSLFFTSHHWAFSKGSC